MENIEKSSKALDVMQFFAAQLKLAAVHSENYNEKMIGAKRADNSDPNRNEAAVKAEDSEFIGKFIAGFDGIDQKMISAALDAVPSSALAGDFAKDIVTIMKCGSPSLWGETMNQYEVGKRKDPILESEVAAEVGAFDKMISAISKAGIEAVGEEKVSVKDINGFYNALGRIGTLAERYAAFGVKTEKVAEISASLEKVVADFRGIEPAIAGTEKDDKAEFREKELDKISDIIKDIDQKDLDSVEPDQY